MAESRVASRACRRAERTVGQLVAESIRFYGDHFWRVSRARRRARGGRGRVRARVARASRSSSRRRSPARSLSAAYRLRVRRSCSTRRPSRGASSLAWLVGWLVFAPVPFLVARASSSRACSGSPRSGSSCRCSSSRRLRRRRGASRGRGSSRAPTSCTCSARSHARDRRPALAVVLVFILRGFGGRRRSSRARPRERRPLAAPLRRRGAALRRPGGAGRVGSRHADLHPSLAALPAGRADAQVEPGPAAEVNRDVEELGAKVLHQWATLGEFDFVNVVEAPDTATIAQGLGRSRRARLDEDPDAARADDRRVRRDDPVASSATATRRTVTPQASPDREELVGVDLADASRGSAARDRPPCSRRPPA